MRNATPCQESRFSLKLSQFSRHPVVTYWARRPFFDAGQAEKRPKKVPEAAFRVQNRLRAGDVRSSMPKAVDGEGALA
jgi:hypothetical protein